MTASGDRRVLLSLADSVLVRAITRPGLTIAGAERLKLAGGTRAVVFLWVPVDGPHAPASIAASPNARAGHRRQRPHADARRTLPSRLRTEAVVIGPPLRGGVWLTGNGPAERVRSSSRADPDRRHAGDRAAIRHRLRARRRRRQDVQGRPAQERELSRRGHRRARRRERNGRGGEGQHSRRMSRASTLVRCRSRWRRSAATT